jgi:peptidoglycan hydrolase CwlO-like protein
MSKKLTKDESKTIQFLVSEFNRFWQSINEKERELTLLEERKTGIQSELTMLLAEINQVRAKEKEFTNKINKKYGDCEINMETFEIVPTTKEESARS